jgi:tellurite resistance protein
MPRKPMKPDDPEQSKRFIDVAVEVAADGEDALERAFEEISRQKGANNQGSKDRTK